MPNTQLSQNPAPVRSGGHLNVAQALNSVCFGQDEAKHVIETELLVWMRDRSGAIQRGNHSGGLRRNVMISNAPGMDPSGLVRAAAESLGLPFARFDAVEVIDHRYRLEELAGRFLRERHGYKPEEALGIVFVDRLDLVASNEGAAHFLAHVAERRTFELAYQGRVIHPHSQQIFFAGAWPLPSQNPMRPESSPAGSRSEQGWTLVAEIVPPRVADVPEATGKEELFMAFPAQAAMLPYVEDDYLRICRSRKPYSPVERIRSLLREHDVAFRLTEGGRAALAELAVEENEGLRGLDKVLRNSLGESCGMALGRGSDIRRIILTEDAVHMRSQPRLERRKRSRRDEAIGVLPARPMSPPPPRPARSHANHSSARLAREQDLEDILRSPKQALGEGETRMSGIVVEVEDSPDGAHLRRLPRRDLVLPRREFCKHTLITGLTGSGKTTRGLYRQLVAFLRDTNGSAIVADFQNTEVEKIISATRALRGDDTRIIYFNPMEPEASNRWNPLDGIADDDDAYSLANVLANSVRYRSASGDGDWFRQQAVYYLCNMIRAVRHRALNQKGEPSNLAVLRDILEAGASKFDELGKETGVKAMTRLAEELRNGNRNTETTLSELTNVLITLCDSRVRRTTARSEFHFEDLEKEPCVLIYALPEHDVDRVEPLTNAFVSRLMDFLMTRQPESGKRPVGLFLDEFASAIGALPEFHRRCNTLRKRDVSLVCAVQHLSQLESVYHQDARNVLASFNHKIFIPPLDHSDAEFVSATSGTIVVDDYMTKDGHTVLSVHPRARPLLSMEDVLNPVADPVLGPRCTFIFPGRPPFLGFIEAAWENEDEIPLLEEAKNIVLPERDEDEFEDGGSDVSAVASPESEFTDVSKLTTEEIEERLAIVRAAIGWDDTTGSARKWWETFEQENADRLPLILKLAEELLKRKATITEFFLSYIYSNTDNIQANLHYLDYTRLKKESPK